MPSAPNSIDAFLKALVFAAYQGRKGPLILARLGHMLMQELKIIRGVRDMFTLVTAVSLGWVQLLCTVRVIASIPIGKAVCPIETLLRYPDRRLCPVIHSCPC